MYQLAKNFLCHSRDLRAIDSYHNFIVTGGSDKKLNIFTYKNNQLSLLSSTDVIQKNILSLKINRHKSQQGLFVIVGYVDGQIIGFDLNCNPIWMIEHKSNISSLDFINSQTFVSGSWDGKAIVWDIKTRKQIAEYGEHKYAVSVYYNSLNDTIISGSQDKSLNMWSWSNGKKIKRHQNAHNDIIRQISEVQQIGFITCSNDQTLKLWSNDLQQIQQFNGHSAFVFSVKSLGLGIYISGGDDRCVKVWRDNVCQQSIQLPASVWQLCFDAQSGDIMVGCSDGFMRIFTKHMERRAPQEEIEAFNKEVLQAASKKSGMSQQEIKKLPLTSHMKAINGKKQGQIRVFRSDLNPEAYMWQGGQWVKIGDVITQNNQGSQTGGIKGGKKYYHGDAYFQAGQYDHIFDVQDQSGIPKTIPFNDGANPLQASQKYCSRQGLSKGYIQQIRKFLMANSSRIPRQVLQQKASNINIKDLKSTPCTSPIQFNDIKDPESLIKKIRQFNENAEGQKLHERELAHIQRITRELQNSATYYQVKFDGFEIDSLKKALKWPKNIKFPIWDLLRAFLKHYQSQTLFSGLQAGHTIISQLCIGLEAENKEAIYTLILKTMCNILIHNTNKNGMLKYFELVLGSIRHISKNSPKLDNKNYLYSMSAFLYNYSIAVIQKNVQKQDELLKAYIETLRIRLQLVRDQENITLLLQAAANILSKHYQKHAQLFNPWIDQYLNKCSNKDLLFDLCLMLGKN